ncbi:hypothetical protein [Paenibacillus campinasensis]|uniref:Transmembrane protein n=1 Tax=Paenibacillus campinasensis TaxID=66347 RepID=A0A268F016_9BACL|nr:hypothetical protein [Paenibacillus campinasensis]PAD78737.1 hypothetical protein CHH67_05950 [Paenibacillus campinasensis]
MSLCKDKVNRVLFFVLNRTWYWIIGCPFGFEGGFLGLVKVYGLVLVLVGVLVGISGWDSWSKRFTFWRIMVDDVIILV